MGLRDVVDAVYDFTIVYNDGKVYQPSLVPVLVRKGMVINVHVRRFPIKEIPVEEEALGDWLMERWKEKDELIEYLLKNGEFPNQVDEPYQHLSMDLK